MAVDLVVLAFDGILTDVHKQEDGFVTGYKRDLAERLAKPDDIERLWREHGLKIDCNSGCYGWERDGKVVAAAYTDPFIRARAVAQEILKMEQGFRGETFHDYARRSEALDRIFTQNHHKECHFFPEAKEFLGSVATNERTVEIVTQSSTINAAAKLARHLGHRSIPIYWADKTALGPIPGVAEMVTLEEWVRPVYLRRADYWRVLSDIIEHTGISADRTVVVGRSYELDLALPLVKGIRGILVAGDVPEIEKMTVRAAGGYVVDNLQGALEKIREI